MRNKWFEIKMWNGEGCHYCEDDNLLRVAKQVWRERKAGYRIVGVNVNFPF